MPKGKDLSKRVSGIIVMYKAHKGFGFAKKDGVDEKDVWFGVNSWKERIQHEKLKPGLKVEFETEMENGKERAINMTVEFPEEGVEDKENKGKKEKKGKSKAAENEDKSSKDSTLGPASQRVSGKIIFYNKEKGFGFAKKDGARDGDKDVWFGVKSLYHHYFHPNLTADMEVEFELDKGYDGRERARNMTGPGGAKIEISKRKRLRKIQEDEDNKDMDSEEIDEDSDEMAEDSEEEVQSKKGHNATKVAPKRKMVENETKSVKKASFESPPPKKKKNKFNGVIGNDSIAQPKSFKKAKKLRNKLKQ